MRQIFPRAETAIDFLSEFALLNPCSAVQLTGHSLGGAIARVIGKELGLRYVTFNAAAPPSSPVENSDSSTNYHIEFDIISAWQSVNVLRISKNLSPVSSALTAWIPYIWVLRVFDSLLPAHSLVMFSNEIPGTVVSAEREEAEITKWLYSLPPIARYYILLALTSLTGTLTSSFPELKSFNQALNLPPLLN